MKYAVIQIWKQAFVANAIQPTFQFIQSFDTLAEAEIFRAETGHNDWYIIVQSW
jgi:hypothetical protein